jgi:hypothetical protein
MKYTFLMIFGLSIFIGGCHVREDYSMNYRFGGAVDSVMSIVPVSNGFTITLPIADVACAAENFKARLDRTGDIFSIVITDPSLDSGQKCAQQFSADVSGIVAGEYELDVSIERNTVPVTILHRELNIQK